jgi:hypothetical protein
MGNWVHDVIKPYGVQEHVRVSLRILSATVIVAIEGNRIEKVLSMSRIAPGFQSPVLERS